MPVVALPSVTYTWFGLMYAFGTYSVWPYPISPLHNYLVTIEQEAMPDFIADQASAQWGSDPPQTPYRQMRFCDPALIMNWVDQQNTETTWDAERGVGIKWDAAAPASLDAWRNRP